MPPEPLDRAVARAAIALANRAPSVHNTQPWRWRVDASSIHLFADPDRALPATDPEGRDLRISCGAALHHLRVALLALGLGTTVHRVPNPAAPHHLAAVEVETADPMPEDLALARAIEHRRSDRRMFSTWPVPDGFLEKLAAAAARQGAGLHVIGTGSARRKVVELVERAAVQQALTPEYAQEIAVWTGRTRSAPEGVPAANVPETPDGAVPVRRFAGREMGQSGLGRGESDGTVLAALATPGDGAVDHLQAGEALSAVLLTATSLGLASVPLSQPLEVATTRDELRTVLPDDQLAPQLLVRFGWAPVSATPVPPTGRRPLDETIDPLNRP